MVESTERTWTDNVINSNVLPINAAKHREYLQTCGFEFCSLPHNFLDGHAHFIGAKIPEGWFKSSDRNRWIEIVKPDGKVFARIFVKYGGYERRTEFTLV